MALSNKMKADVEWVVGVIRAGPDFQRHGDPYEFVVTIMKENDKAFLMAASGIFTKETYDAIKQLVASLGIKEVKWDKKNIKARNIKKQLRGSP